MGTNLKLPVEAYTTTFDYLKHLTTLSTGSILLIVTLMENFSRCRNGKLALQYH
jgi:hypothetical protein